MTKRTVSGFLGLLVMPDPNTVRILEHTLTHRNLSRHLKQAAFRVPPKGAHITLFQARNFKQLPVSVARTVVDGLNDFLVTSPSGSVGLHFETIEPYVGNRRFLFWQALRSPELAFAHAMSVAVCGWVDKSQAEDKHALERRIHGLPEKEMSLARALNHNEHLFGYGLVHDEFMPHITLAADPDGFPKFKPFKDPHIGSAGRVVLARMGEWGKIDEILYDPLC
ncbi:hypothetical protein M0Q28_02735 [Patescibacteria group bacterium]|jgi:hypothetical protein|nr:hypothetical protein [Patescibacteria group bacterium]